MSRALSPLAPRRRRALWICLIPLYLCALPAAADRLEIGSRNAPAFGRLTLAGVERVSARDSTEDLRLARLSRRADARNLLFLDFEQGPPQLLRDEASNYRIVESSYIESREARSGRSAALFNRRENRIVIRSPEELWPGVGAVDDFTIEAWIKPIYFARRNVLFRKVGMLDGVRRGLEIYFESGVLKATFYNAFQDADEQLHTLTLSARRPAALGQWVHIAVSYEAARGRLLLYRNGQEDAALSAANRKGVFSLHFHPLDRSHIFLGESYSGLIDEFRLTPEALGASGRNPILASNYAALETDYVSLNSQQRTGVAISEVFEARGSQRTRRGVVRYEAIEPPGSALNFFVRHSQTPFDAATPDSALAWKRLSSSDATLPSFKFIQWKAEFKADPTGAQSPTLASVRIDYTPHTAPAAPTDLRVATALSGADRICLEWAKNPERDVHEGGGYYIYYGVRPGEYLGRISVGLENGRPAPIRGGEFATLPLSADERFELRNQPDALQRRLRNRVRFILTNEIIGANTPRNREQPRLPYLTQDRAYYFAISAYDSEGVESELSNEAHYYLRPAGDL